ncbi:hypothetical protein BLNAU_16264 [Blattamonas nauphoetae]|uniref:Uncharacterized protein n=1 Tax=Blattamonas nauphoetae TaxID=2049346 RepID=A0ABQ9XAU5_9EUKA|nr:hypothetical protein BLNAU_16264 [Blattamonas nauphoetae]
MLAFILTSILTAFKIDNYEFEVEHLTLNGTAYSLRVSNDETLYFNYMDTVALPSECEHLGWTTNAYSIVTLKDMELCVNTANIKSGRFSLIPRSGSSAPAGLRSVYRSALANLFQIDLICNRTESMRVSRSTSGSYLVTWHNPAGCARVVG